MIRGGYEKECSSVIQLEIKIMATTDSRAAKATISSTIDEVGGASGGDGGRIESENTTTTMTSHDDFVTGPDGDGGWFQAVRNVRTFIFTT